MASGPITSWKIEGEVLEAVTDFIFLVSKITRTCDCSHEIERCLLFALTDIVNLDNIKNRDIILPAKILLIKSVFSIVMYGCKSWIIKEAECWNTDVFELFWRRLSRVPWLAKSSNWNRREGDRVQHLKEFHTPRQSINWLESNGSKMAYKSPSTRPWSSISKLNDISRGAMTGQGTKRPKYRWWPNFLYPFPQMDGIIFPLISLRNYPVLKN